MNEDWNPTPEPGSSLENSVSAAMPDKSLEKQDTLNSVGSFFKQPLERLVRQIHENPEQTPADQKRLEALRNSPGFKLIAHSTLLLKASQLDMDYPPSLRQYVRAQLKALLQQSTGKALSPDKLKIRFRTDTHPEVDDQGRERYSRRMSLTDIAVLSFNGAMMHALMQHHFADKPLNASAPAFTASVALNLIINAPWKRDYTTLMETFWARHRDTYRALAKLSFLDELARQHAEKLVSREGFILALDALGLEHFPTTELCLQLPMRGTRSTAYLLTINGQVLPDALQLRSNNTSHCFIHLPGGGTPPGEYISDDPQHMTEKLIKVMNAAHAFAMLPDNDHAPEQAMPQGLSLIDGDVLTAVTQAQEKRSLDYLEQHVGLAPQPDPFKAIKGGFALLGAVDIWQAQPDILDQLPVAHKHAAHLMAVILREKYNLNLSPDQVFIRYLRGHSTQPLGNARQPGIDFRVPSETPLSLSEALVSNYRVASPVGYIDNGGRSVVYVDPTGKGEWSADRELLIDPHSIENEIRNVDFLQLMTQRIDEFWEQHGKTIETSLQSHFMTQALLCLKQGSLRRTGFDLIVKALGELDSQADDRSVQWSVPGFFLRHSIAEDSTAHDCPNLLILSHPDHPRRVLLQAGMVRAFAEFNSEDELKRYFQYATRSDTWRQCVLNYMPERHHQRLTYILKIWGGEQAPNPPFSVLRPWTDGIINQDAHQAAARKLGMHRLGGSPFAYVRQSLRRNSLWNAQDTIVTSAEVSLRYWTRQLNHLQFLLAPMSVLLTPALIASLATELGITALNISSANLPGARYAEKRQALLSVLSLGLLHLGPATPRLAGALRRLATPVKPVLRTATSLTTSTKSFGTWLNRSMRMRNTRLEKFFYTNAMLKTWTIAGRADLATQAVKAWKLRRQFLLWTADTRQARTLVVSSHGYYLPWSKNTGIPTGTELQVYAPHGYSLVDPSLHRVVSRKVAPFATLGNQGNTIARPPLHPYAMTDKLLAGSAQQGMIKNYSLSKFQSLYYESYRDISQIVRNSNRSALMSTLPPAPMDVLTVRSRFGMPHPTLEQLFDALSETGIHYDKILLVHCRCSLFSGLTGRAPVFRAT